MTRRKRLCLLLAVLTLLLALSACGAQSKLVLATTGMEPTLDLTLPDTITLPDKGRDTVYKCYVDKAYSMALAAALLDMDADTMQTQLAGRLSYDAQTGYIQYYTPTEELMPGDLSEFPTDAQLEQTVRERLKKGAPELADTSRIVFSSATYETNVSSKTVDVTPEVNGRMVYGKYHISVSFDRDGNVTALTQLYAPLKEGGTKTVRLADAKTVQARLDAHVFSANIAQQLTGCTITGVEQAYYMNAGFNAEGDYALYPFYVLRGQGTAADGGVQDFEVLVYALVEDGCKDIIALRIFGFGIEKRFRIPDDVHVTTIGPTVDLGNILNFDAEQSRRNMRLGYFDAQRVLYGLYGSTYYIDRTMSEDTARQQLLEYIGLGDHSLRTFHEKALPQIAKALKCDGDYYDLLIAVLEHDARALGIESERIVTDMELLQTLLAQPELPEQTPEAETEAPAAPDAQAPADADSDPSPTDEVAAKAAELSRDIEKRLNRLLGKMRTRRSRSDTPEALETETEADTNGKQA